MTPHPLVQTVLNEIAQRKISCAELEARSGVASSTVWRWRRTSHPTIVNLEAVANTVGLTLKLEKVNDAPQQ